MVAQKRASIAKCPEQFEAFLAEAAVDLDSIVVSGAHRFIISANGDVSRA